MLKNMFSKITDYKKDKKLDSLIKIYLKID